VSETIHLHDYLLNRGRGFYRLGRFTDARAHLRGLLNDSVAAPHLRGEAHRLFGEMDLKSGCFQRARRHFAAAARLHPLNADTLLRYAEAVSADPDADPKKAVSACRRATRLYPFEPRYWVALGHSCMAASDLRLAEKSFRRAARLRPVDLESLAGLIHGLVSLGNDVEAERVLSAARFRSPHCPGIVGLWNQFQFDRAHRQQERERTTVAGAPTIVPFPGRNSETPAATASPVVLRADRKSRPAPHLLRMFGKKSDPRRAN
jgi:Flp pilus assembly protein TadD